MSDRLKEGTKKIFLGDTLVLLPGLLKRSTKSLDKPTPGIYCVEKFSSF
jgi:hypothetical protein